MSEQVKTKKVLKGCVVSNKMDKTINVVVERKVPHPKYKKYVVKRTKIFAHDEANTCQVGDLVEIQEGRPLAKNKSWVLTRVLKKVAQEIATNN